jgi:hypothetical protein
VVREQELVLAQVRGLVQAQVPERHNQQPSPRLLTILTELTIFYFSLFDSSQNIRI